MKKIRFPSINGLRALSILIVISCHFQQQNGIYNHILQFRFFMPIYNFITAGSLGVNIFFVISGFLITSLLVQEINETKKISLKNFYLRRTLRIFPAYYFMLLIYFILQMLALIHIDFIYWVTSLTYTKYFNINGKDLHEIYTGHAWSLSIEEHFYLFWPAIFKCGKKAANYAAFFLLVLSPIVRIFLFFHQINWITDFSLFTRVDSIAMGCLFALNIEYILKLFGKRLATISIFSFVLLFTLCQYNLLIEHFKFHLAFIFIPLGTSYGTLANLCIALILINLIYGKKDGVIFNFLNSRCMNFIGTLSYSLYLWQQFFIYSPIWRNNTALSLLFILIAALSSYYFIEKPFLSLKAKFN